LFLEETDRRAVVHAIPDEPKPFEWYDAIDQWRKNGGPSHVMHYLLHDVDLSDYHPKKPAPVTQSKREMIALSKSDLDIAVDTIRENPDAVFSSSNLVNKNPFLTTTQLQSFINKFTDGNSTLIAISKAMRRGGFIQRTCLTDDGTQRLWCVRDCDKWLNRQPGEWGEEFNKQIRNQKF
jgi:hypothetical protein